MGGQFAISNQKEFIGKKLNIRLRMCLDPALRKTEASCNKWQVKEIDIQKEAQASSVEKINEFNSKIRKLWEKFKKSQNCSMYRWGWNKN